MKNLIDSLTLSLFRTSAIETLGWTLLHFLWQGTLIALILAVLVWLLRNRHPSLRYLLSCASLAVMLACPIVTYLVLDSSSATPPVIETALPQQTEVVAEPALVNDVQAQPAVAPVVFAPEGGTGKKVSWLERNLKPWLPYLVAFWGVGVLVLSVRLLGGLWYLRKLRTKLTRPVSTMLMSQLNNVAERLGLARAVQLRESFVVTVPLVVGWLKPMILLPSSVMSGLSVKQLEMILAHELAHIRRHDYLVNLLQSVIETLLFYHPAVWWVSHRIRVERELCCDDLAVKVCGGDKQSYAQALSDLDDLRTHVQFAQAATGGSLLNRVLRLVDKAMPRSLEPRQWLAGLSMIAVAVVMFTVIGANVIIAQDTITSNDQWTPVSKQDAKGITMVQVPAGSFEMGSSETDLDYILQLCNEAKMEGECERSWFEDELGGGTQTFTESFWIDETEVTRAAYQRCVDEGVCTTTPADNYSSSDTQPINNVSWYQAAKYCDWRGASLPTEAEWEYAARGPDELIFPWGNSLVGDEANHCDSNCANTPNASELTFINADYDDGHAITSPVGSYAEGASWVGALDMAGNLWEWTRTKYQAYPYQDDVRNVSGYKESVGGELVMLGGSFFNPAGNLPAAFRGKIWAGESWFGFGFRCVRSDADF